MTVTVSDATSESIDDFGARARRWAQQHMTPRGAVGTDADAVASHMRVEGLDPDDTIARGRMILKLAAADGFGGITFPVEYGGRGLSLGHLRAFAAACANFDLTPLAQFTLT